MVQFYLDILDILDMSAFKKKPDVISHTNKLANDINPSALQEIARLIRHKMNKIQDIIQRILQTLNHYRGLNIISNSDLIVCTSTLIDCFDKSSTIVSNLDKSNTTTNPNADANENSYTVDRMNEYIDQLQQIVDKLSIIMCGYGAASIEDIFFISFGSELEQPTNNVRNDTSSIWKEKLNLIVKHVRPIGYKTFHWKQSKTRPKNTSDNGQFPTCVNKNVEDAIQIELANQFECFDIDLNGKTNYVKIYGIRVVVHNEKTQKTLIIQGLVDDVPIDCIHNFYIKCRKTELNEVINASDDQIKTELMKRLLETVTIKDILINGNDDFCKKTQAIIADVNYVKLNKLTSTIRKFVDMDIYNQRTMIMNLLIYNKEDDIQYITYLFYDLISTKNANGNTIDSAEQQLLYESFPWKIKLYFKDTMKQTIKYTKDMMSKYDINRVSLEQQIYVMKVPENVKEKAMTKLKEIKGKSDDSGAKSKQYLEGLLKIPFNVYREETILTKSKKLNRLFTDALQSISENRRTEFIAQHMQNKIKTNYSPTEIVQLSNSYELWMKSLIIDHLSINLPSYNTKQVNLLWSIFQQNHPNSNVTKPATKQNKSQIIEHSLETCQESTLFKMMDAVVDNDSSYQTISNEFKKSKTIAGEFKHDLKNVVNVLDESIYGHENAKTQILKIIGQWMSGEQTGYCFGFEGSPGVGKTSLAKNGLAKCLKDENGESRPFAFIAVGGSCNGSTLEGHSYTYVNSTWGRIVDILMDSKCMNPIIYIDELDKVSKTEHGKEIIGILMHLIDTTQNSVFQDKYFSGIDIDLSKALFIFSYNDPSQIDPILLDRIHRIKFDNLSSDEKLVITRKYILPEINRKMGFDECIELSDEIITHIIETYTLESGVRKLKEVIFDLFGEVNIELLRCDSENSTTLPISITIDSLENKYLAKYDKIREKKIHATDRVGVINGLWANSYGKGGIIPIQAAYFPTSTFLELRLTGMQGDVMKESMNVAKNLAWDLLNESEKTACLEKFEKTKEQGIHIHCPDGATPKDGPSAGGAITSVIYSLLSSKPIKHNIAMTGEINLQGDITEIGGLEQKILGGVRAGVKTFLYPNANEPEFNQFMKKYGTKKSLEEIRFVQVSEINEVFKILFNNE